MYKKISLFLDPSVEAAPVLPLLEQALILPAYILSEALATPASSDAKRSLMTPIFFSEDAVVNIRLRTLEAVRSAFRVEVVVRHRRGQRRAQSLEVVIQCFKKREKSPMHTAKIILWLNRGREV